MKNVWAFYLLLMAVPFSSWGEASLTVRGVATLDLPADRLRVQVGVITEGVAADVVLQENSEKIERIINEMRRLGVMDGEMQTAHFSIDPIYARRPDNAPVEWFASVIGYKVHHVLSIAVDALDRAGLIIQAAQTVGANTIDQLGFELKEPQNWREEVIEAATERALEEAAILAKAAQLRLVKILSITLDEESPGGGIHYMKTSLPIQGGQVRLSASVKVIYEVTGEN